jgi:hypothetical protein
MKANNDLRFSKHGSEHPVPFGIFTSRLQANMCHGHGHGHGHSHGHGHGHGHRIFDIAPIRKVKNKTRSSFEVSYAGL